MKSLVPILIMLSLFGCKPESKQVQILTDGEWRDVLINTLWLAEGNKPYIFKEFENIGSIDIISKTYINCTNLGYELNDSILNKITNRKNKPITNKLDTMLNISYVFDTTGFKENFVIYSEPFYINEDIICISMSNNKILENIILQWVFFLKKQNESFKIIEFYDVKKGMFYKPSQF